MKYKIGDKVVMIPVIEKEGFPSSPVADEINMAIKKAGGVFTIINITRYGMIIKDGKERYEFKECDWMCGNDSIAGLKRDMKPKVSKFELMDIEE